MASNKITTEKLEITLQNINDWIKAGDQKVSVFLALQGIILSIIIPNYLNTITLRFQTHMISFWNGFFIVLASLALGYSVFESINAIFPRIGNKSKSHLYFGNIRNIELKQYIKDMRKLSMGDYFDLLCEQIHVNSRIASNKHERFQRSIVFFLIGIFLLITSYLSFKFF